jgi:diguanylate cyclase (GGDEF)-like protein
MVITKVPAQPLNLLLIEDSEDDAALVTRTLTRAGFAVNACRVDSADGLREALLLQPWDIAVADYTMPSFSGTKALTMVREHGVDLPFIFVSGTIGEDIAVAAMKTGAHDYIMKGNLARLPPAVERELREAQVRRERHKADERVAYLAYHDPLTELPNRTLLHDRLKQAILTSRRENRPLSLLVLDLDGFKEINDGLGHHAGDRVLQQVASRLRVCLRESDTVARLGGDEFAIVLPGTDTDGAELAVEGILHDLEAPIMIDDRPLTIRGSIGIAGFPAHASTGFELLQKADIAMYVAKRDRSGYSVYSGERDGGAEQRLTLMTSMRQGIEAGQFVLHYQPILQLRTNAVVAVEALLRWNHPQHGRLRPRHFIQIAEHSGLITPLTAFAIARAMSEWRTVAPHIRVAVNLSPQSLHDRTFPQRVKEMLSDAGIDGTWLALEITENVLMSDPERSTVMLRQLHEMGIQLVMDDFGTGYSSLSYLRRLPVDQLKIDKSFVTALAEGEDEALVRSIIDLAHNLKLGVVAEGVESEAIRERLMNLGCDCAQGHLYSAAAPASAITAWIAEHTTRSRPQSVQRAESA